MSKNQLIKTFRWWLRTKDWFYTLSNLKPKFILTFVLWIDQYYPGSKFFTLTSENHEITYFPQLKKTFYSNNCSQPLQTNATVPNQQLLAGRTNELNPNAPNPHPWTRNEKKIIEIKENEIRKGIKGHSPKYQKNSIKKLGRIQPTWKGPISPVRRELAMSSATIKQDETQPASANHTIFATQSVTLHGTAIFAMIYDLPFDFLSL